MFVGVESRVGERQTQMERELHRKQEEDTEAEIVIKRE